MALPSVSSSHSSTSTNNVSAEEQRWLIIGICVNKVLAPALRKVLGNEIPKWYQTLVKPPVEIDKQTSGKFVKNLPPSAIKLNYDSINNNTVLKSPKLYDYAVKDPLSLAKLFMKPFMAHFTGFDLTMDVSALLSVMCEAQPFLACGADVLAKKVRSDVRNEWAHCDFSHWTEPVFQTALNDIESLVKALGLTNAEEQIFFEDINNWRKNEMKLCFGNVIDCELLGRIHVEVGNLQESVRSFTEDSKVDKEKLQHCLQNFQISLSEEIRDLRENVDELELEQLTLHNQYVSTIQDVEKIKSEVTKITTTSKEIIYVFDAPSQNPWFAGRSSEIKELASLLQLDDEKSKSKSEVNIAAVCGLGGVGKTSLAIEYAHQKKDYYTGGVYWFSGEDDTKFESSVNDLATRLNTQSDSFVHTLSATLAIISRNENKWLLILDNMDRLDLSANIVKLVCGPWQHGATGHFLITTRRKPTAVTNDIQNLDERGCLSLKCFQIDEGKKFLLHRVGIVHDKEVDVPAEKLVQVLGGLPLALEQAGAYIKSLHCTVFQYLEVYGKQRLRLLNQQKASPVSVYESPERLAIRTTWHLNFEHIKLMLDNGKAVSRFLNASAFLNPNEIQKDIINVGEPPVEDKEFNECVMTTLGQHQVLKMLTDFSLFKVTLSYNLSVHHLVQEVIRNNLNQEEELQSLSDAIRLVYYAFQSCPSPDELLSSERQGRPSIISGDQSRFYKWHKLCLHTYELVEHLQRVINSDVDREKIFQPETARIVYECAIHLSANSKHDEAKKVANFATDIFNLGNRKEIPASSLFLHIIPLPELVRKHIQYSCNVPATLPSKDECRDELEVHVATPVHSVTSDQLDEMQKKGNVLFKKGLYNDALKTYSDAIEISKKCSFPFEVRLLSNRASVYIKLRRYQDALLDAEEYILQRPKCWKGYARKALALVELNDIQGAYLSAALAYYYHRNVFDDFAPFGEKFGSCSAMHLLLCRDTSDLSAALRMIRTLSIRNLFVNNPKDLAVIILEKGDYLVSSRTVERSLFCQTGELPIGNCILVCSEGECSVTFDDHSNVVIGSVFSAYNIHFKCRFSSCTFLLESVVKLTYCSFTSSNNTYTSFCCNGKMNVDFCKFYDCISGGLLVTGDAEIANSEFYGNSLALEVRNGGRLVVRRSKVYGNKKGLHIGPQAKECVVDSCEVYENVRDGIFVTECPSDVVIKGSHIYDNDLHGILVVTNSNVSILDNEILRNSSWAIAVVCAGQAIVRGNKIHNNQCGGIHLIAMASIEKSVIEFNDISFNFGPGIYETGSRAVFTESRENKLQDNKEEINQSKAEGDAKLCYTCKEPKETLRKCSKCLMAQYCGEQCQKSDWKNHKEICRYIVPVQRCFTEYNHVSSISGSDMYKEGLMTKHRENKLQDNKDLRYQPTAESEATFCYCCNKFGNNLKKCTNCFTAKYCGKQCQKIDWKNHKEQCGRLLSDGSIVVDYVQEPIMGIHYSPYKWDCDLSFIKANMKALRAPGLLPVGPKYCEPPSSTIWFIAKMSASVGVNETEKFDPSIVRLYDRSLTIDGFLAGANQIYHLVRQHGATGQIVKYCKKLFMWVKGPEDGKLRVFVKEFPLGQNW